MNTNSPPLLPNLRHLRAFAGVAKLGRVSAAAESIHLSQPAISQAIKGLEAALDIQLFERLHKGMELTEAGQTLLRRTERAFEKLYEGVRNLLATNKTLSASKKIAVQHALTTSQLKALIAISRTQNFTLAARDLGISQPSLHETARRLEATVDVPLFEKRRSGILLTAEALKFVIQVKAAIGEIRQALSELSTLRGYVADSIAIGTMPSARSFLLPRAINHFATRYPNVAVNIIDGPYVDLVKGLRHSELDFVLGATRHRSPSDDIWQRNLFDDALAVISRADHPLQHHATVTFSDLREYPWVVAHRGTPTRECCEVLFNRMATTNAPAVIESSSLVLTREVLLGSNRLTLISLREVYQELHSGLLSTVPIGLGSLADSFARPIGITLRRDWYPTAVQSYFIECIKDVSRNVESLGTRSSAEAFPT